MPDKTSHIRGFSLPVLQGILPVVPTKLPMEILAGVTFACLAIPEVMGYTKIAGTPVVTGLYTILIPMTLFAIFGSSRHLVVGADSATAAITASALAAMAVSGPSEYMALASLLALIAGVLLIAARIVGLGFLADFLSRTVLVGFLTGVGIQVSLGELPGLFGIETSGHGTIQKLSSAYQNLDQVSWATFLIVAAVLVIVIGAKRLSPKIPGPLIAVIGAIGLSWYYDFEGSGIALLGPVPSGLPSLSIPDVSWTWTTFKQLLPTALAILVVILAQSAATSRAYAVRYGDKFSENTDLVGLGIANIGAALSATFVVNGSPTKTEMVAGAGGQSQIAQLTTALVVLLVLLFLTQPLAFLPNAVLSAVVFLIGLKLIDLQGLRVILAQAPTEFWIAMGTAAIVVVIGVEQGIIVAMALSLIDHTRKGYRPKNSVIIKASDGEWLTQSLERPGQFQPGLIIYRFSHGMYYANAQRFSNEVTGVIAATKDKTNWLCIDASAIDDIDFTAGYALKSIVQTLSTHGTKVVFLFAEPALKAELKRYGVTDLIPESLFFTTGHEMIEAYEAEVAKS
ncbi:SulP family inorganic anion transporter [Ruegeria sp.]|uniref:SulP family inorganic anion transporter n=1 Tax=Ruegeria sp. TaxID=1879320 RepID=UPI003B5C7A3A